MFKWKWKWGSGEADDLRRIVRRSSHSRVQNYRGLKSKICILGIEKRAQNCHQTISLFFSVDRDGNADINWSGVKKRSWEKSSRAKLFQVISVEKRLIASLDPYELNNLLKG